MFFIVVRAEIAAVIFVVSLLLLGSAGIQLLCAGDPQSSEPAQAPVQTYHEQYTTVVEIPVGDEIPTPEAIQTWLAEKKLAAVPLKQRQASFGTYQAAGQLPPSPRRLLDYHG